MIQITLGDQKLPHIEYEHDGLKRSFDIDHNTLFEFLMRNCYESKSTKKKFEMPVFETPALPPGTVKYLSLPDDKVVLFMEMKQKNHNIKYHDTKFDNVLFPNLLFIFVFKPTDGKYVLERKRCFCFKDKVLRDTTKLYRFPFSHVQADGDMCFFFMSEVQDLAQMSSFIHNWMSASFTDHYYSQSTTNNWNTSLRHVFTKLQNETVFDYDKLVESKITVSDIVKQFVKNYHPEG